MHGYDDIRLMKVVLLGAICAGLAGVAVADGTDYTYQSLTNLGSGVSSRILLMNNDTNETCPIRCQGYYDTDEAATAVGDTFWWHDGEPKPTGTINRYLNLLEGANHVLYQKTASGRKALWTLVQCRAGSGGYHGTSDDNAQRNYLPWSKTCQPIAPNPSDPNYSAPIPDTWASGAANLGGIKQVAHISMRCTEDSRVYSPLYDEGIGEIYFDVVNGWHLPTPDSIRVEYATGMSDGGEITEHADGQDWEEYQWEPVKCDMFEVHNCDTADAQIVLPDENKQIERLTLNTTNYFNKMYYRVRAKLNYRGPVRFRIRRLSSGSTSLDYDALIFIDNIVVSYPSVSAVVSTTGFETHTDEAAQNGSRASLGYVGAFTEALLSKGLTGVKPRMTFSAVTDGLPPWVEPHAEVSRPSCVYRWRYLDQAYGPWETNTTETVTSIDDTNIIWNTSFAIPDKVGDLEFSYTAWISGTRYRYFDYALNEKLAFPDDAGSATYVECATNFTARIREGVSPWQEMHLVSEVFTNLAGTVSATNDWTMELIGDHTWRGFVDTRTNYMGKTAHIRFIGKNLWETNAFSPAVASQAWYFPPSETGGDLEIPMGAVAVTNLGSHEERDITLDCSTGYLIFEFNDESGAFTVNHAEYQDFNLWTPDSGKENLYVGNYVNTSYVGRAKQEFTLDLSKWAPSRSSSAFWGENFDSGATVADFPFDTPFGLNEITPNGWVANNGMYVNGMFSAASNKTTYGMALQMQGRGTGSIALIDPADVPQGIGTVSFTARLAQYLEFGDFYYYVDGTGSRNYAISAKAAMTNHRRQFSDVSTGSPTLSLVTYYRPGKGCYEFRITRVYSTWNNLWDSYGVMEIGIYKWYKVKDPSTGNSSWTSKKLNSLRLGNNSTYVPVTGRMYTNNGTATAYQNYFVPQNSGNLVTDNANWTSIYFGAYSKDDGSVYLEGGVGGKETTTDARADLMVANGIMMSVSFTDSDSPLEKGSYGVCSRECPAVFGNIQKHALSAVGPYKGYTGRFAAGTSEKSHILDGDWGSTSPNRIITWEERKAIDGTDYSGTYDYGLCTAPLTQKLYLNFADSGDSSNWRDSGLELNLSSYVSTNVAFSPHTTTPVNIQIAVGGDSSDPRTDVVVDNLELSQWRAEDAADDFIDGPNQWAFTDAWISTTTNDVYRGADAGSSDSVGFITKCGYYREKVEGTENEYIYVFTNTVNGALGNYARFVPATDLTILGAFGIGGGGAGGAGGGGGGGGNGFQITNQLNYAIGDEFRVYVGVGGSYSTMPVRSANASSYWRAGAGGNSYLSIHPLNNPAGALYAYYGYGGGVGGNWRDGSTAQPLYYTQGGNGQSTAGPGGGSARCVTTNSIAVRFATAGLTDKSRYASGLGAGVLNKNEAAGGGGGGGLLVYTTGTTWPNSPNNISYYGGDGEHGVAGASAGRGGRGFPVSAIFDEEIRKTVMKLAGIGENGWVGGGGGGGGGTNAPANQATYGLGALYRGKGLDGGGDGAEMADTYNGTLPGGDGANFIGGGGGGGAIHAVVNSSGNNARNWITRGGKGGDGVVILHVRTGDRVAMLQPMRGTAEDPMSVRTPFMNGISLLGVSWKWADSNAVLHVQVNTNGVNEGNIGPRTTELTSGWTDVCDPLKFLDMPEERRNAGSTNILIGIRAPISGIVRVLMDPEVVAKARIGSTNDLYAMYGAVSISAMLVIDEPELDDRSWWGWNIMPTKEGKWASLYDPADLGPGRSCGLNFSGESGTGEDDPLFADSTDTADYAKHDPFVQTPRFTNSIGQVTFKARVTETNCPQSGWVTIAGCANPGEDNDANWTVLTNIEITADTTIFDSYKWRLPSTYSFVQALRLTAWGAAEGRTHREDSGQPFGGTGSSLNPIPVQRVLIDEVTVTQPMVPKLAFGYPPRPFRHGMSSSLSIPAEKIQDADEQPILGETFGMQVLVVPNGMEDELDVSSIRVYMAWYPGQVPWGYENWKTAAGAMTRVELARASDWSEDNLVYRSSPDSPDAFIPPQIAGDDGYQVVQYHIWMEYCDKNGNQQEPRELKEGDWTRPEWYNPIDFNKTSGGAFSAYTILDTISPRRAWFNEINMYIKDNLSDETHQYLEIAAPQGFDMTGWSVNYIQMENTYTLRPLASLGYSGVEHQKLTPYNNGYVFYAIQSPKTKAANSYPDVNDGTWKSTAFNDGVENVRRPYALRLVRPNGIIEHEVVYMCTNTSTSRVRYTYDGTNFLKLVSENVPGGWIYAGEDSNGDAAKDYSLGVYTNHGESVSCWTNWMEQTPGDVNRLADGVTLQYIDPKYFEPPGGTNLWIYASVDSGSLNNLAIVVGDPTNRYTTAVIIVPQGSDGTFSTNVVYHVRKWFEFDSVVTNEFGASGGEATPTYVSKDAEGSTWVLDLSHLKVSDPDVRKFEVTASVKNSSSIPGAAEGGIDPTDPYYPAVIDWLQNYDEDTIRLARFYGLDNQPVLDKNGEEYKLSLKEMYWLDIPPVCTNSLDWEWIFKAGMGGGASGADTVGSVVATAVDGALVTNIRVTVTMMISNRVSHVAYPPYTLRGLEPGSVSSNYNERTSKKWDSVTFKVQGALQTNGMNKVWRPLRWFTFCPESFGAPGTENAFTRTIELHEPHTKSSPGYSYDWDKFPTCPVWYRCAIDEVLGPITVYQLNDDNALLTPSGATP